RMISKQTFKNSILNNVKDKKLCKELEKIYNMSILPVKISHIQKTKEKINMIDISVKNQNFIANGIIVHNSAQRYARIRLEMKKEFFKRVAELVNKTFLGMKELKGILIGGPMPTKDEFVDGDFINNELKKKIVSMQDLSYTGDFGLNELVDKSKDALEKEAVMQEKKLVTEFFELLRKDPGKAAYGKEEVLKAIKAGAAEKILVSEDLSDDELEEVQEKAEEFGTEINIISTETREGVQIRDLGRYAAILRYALS
ncbi:MAG: ribosomal L7Ae/L30e/S12e/Gadd45 family protein, partial [Nanoarchaeota archaeon]|nr:ribosomal L7Ae/L30e/S12e/Gadd45 family protein [Nanoarchaeota archaeon]